MNLESISPEVATSSSTASELASSLLKRLESTEPLNPILPGARRLAQLVNREVERIWLTWEITGLNPQMTAGTATERLAYEIWEPLHTMPNAIELSSMLINQPPKSMAEYSGLKARTTPVLAAGPMRNLESEAASVPMPGAGPRAIARQSLNDSISQALIREVVQRVQNRVHQFVSTVSIELMRMHSLTTILGLDAITVFAAGGELLNNLMNAVEDLGWPGKEGSVCLSARSQLEVIGLELYSGDGAKYVSPIDQKVYNPTQSESHRLHAFLDSLYEKNLDEQRRADIVDAKHAISRVRKSGSRAKTTLMTHQEAESSVRDAYQVAHAICFAGGFPPRAL